jgi:hypothetical protein
MHIKVKMSLYMHYRYIVGWEAVIRAPLFAMVLDRRKWSASHPDHFTLEERIPTSN